MYFNTHVCGEGTVSRRSSNVGTKQTTHFLLISQGKKVKDESSIISRLYRTDSSRTHTLSLFLRQYYYYPTVDFI
jgi:hypothetical protein